MVSCFVPSTQIFDHYISTKSEVCAVPCPSVRLNFTPQLYVVPLTFCLKTVQHDRENIYTKSDL